jgi:hypothetical protein
MTVAAAAQPADARPGAENRTELNIVPPPGQMIGSGEDAQNTIVYQTIKWCFIAGAVISVAVYFAEMYKGSASPGSANKDTWGIFAAIITLSLGYIFGRGHSK